MKSNQMMKAVVLRKTGKPEVLKVSEVPIPQVKNGWVLVKIRAFGINRSELMLRSYEADTDYIALPRIPGIECAGEIIDPSDSNFTQGEPIIALMGGMGRSFDGSYAEYALLPASNVFHIKSDLPWAKLAAIPETWFTAWGSLVECLDIHQGQKVYVRAGTSALGIAAIQIAKSFGCEVTTSSRSESKRSHLEMVGADYVSINHESLFKSAEVKKFQGFDAVLELVGPSTLAESLKLTQPHGKVCVSGILGAEHVISEFDPIKDIPNGVSLMGFFSNYPTQKTIDTLFRHMENHDLAPIVGKVLPLEKIDYAHTIMEDNAVFGKVVVTLD